MTTADLEISPPNSQNLHGAGAVAHPLRAFALFHGGFQPSSIQENQ